MPCLRVLRIAVLAGMLAVMPTNLVASARQAPGPAPVQIPPRVADGPSEILWDNWGVPHIFATTAVEVGYAYGWAQTHNHANRLLRLYGLARGRAAEYWGERYLLSDHVMRTVGIPAAGREGYAAQTAEFRRYLDAFAAGVNAYAREHPDQIPDEMQQVLPVQGADLVAHTQRVLFTFLSGGNDPPLVDFEGLPISVRPAGEPAPEPAPAPEAGSNGWAIAPGHAASGHSLLFANPHLPWDSDLSTQFEAQLVAPEAGLDFYGTTLLGVPVPVIGFNDSLGWTHTVNTLDGFDLYALTTSGDGYVLDGEVRSFDTEQQTIRVRQPDGSVRDEALVIRRSVQGPVVGSTLDGRPLAARVVGLIDHQYGALQEWWDMARARNLGEFQAALERLQIPMFMVIYADREGHILSVFNGRVPVRPFGDFSSWIRAVPGDTSATLWTDVHPYEDLPKVIDSPSGWVQNSNSPPWYMTVPSPLNPNDYPAYIAPRFLSLREQRGIALLQGNPRFSLDDLNAARYSSRMELADRVLDDLIAAARASDSPLARQAADVLAAWDRTANPDSRGGVLFQLWGLATLPADVLTPGAFAVPWDPSNPMTTPRGLADPAAAVMRLEAVASQLRDRLGSLDVPYGTVNRLRREGTTIDLPGNGASGEPLGSFHVIHYFASLASLGSPELPPDGRLRSVAGDTFVAEVEFGPDRATARVLVAYGNATQPGSPHIGDQLAVLARQEMRPAWRTREELQGHIEEVTPISGVGGPAK